MMAGGFAEKFKQKKLGDKSAGKSPVADILGQKSEAVIRVHHSELYSVVQVRKVFNEETIRELGRSMKNESQHHPIIVSPRDKKGYCIQKGERRWRGAQFEDLMVDIIVRQPSSDESKEIIGQLGENIHNDPLTPLEIAESLHRLESVFGLDTEQLKEAVSKSGTYISQHLSLLKLPEPVQDLAQTRAVKDVDTLNILRKAHELNAEKTVSFLESVASNGVSRKEAREFHRALKDPAPVGYRPPSREMVITLHREAKSQNGHDFAVTPEYLFKALFPGQPWEDYEHGDAFTDDMVQFIAELDKAFKPATQEGNKKPKPSEPKIAKGGDVTPPVKDKQSSAADREDPTVSDESPVNNGFLECNAEKVAIKVRVDGEVGTLIMTRVDPNGENVWVNMPYGELTVPVGDCELVGVVNGA